jgi:hypothetical protein
MADIKKKELNLLGKTIDDVLAQQGWGRQVHLFSLARGWRKVVGRERALHSMPAYFRRDVLWIYVQDSIWMQQMQLAKPELLAKINNYLKNRQVVDDLRWVMQPAELIDVAVEAYVSPPVNVDPAAERQFRVLAENIADPDTREALCNLWLRLTTKNNSR